MTTSPEKQVEQGSHQFEAARWCAAADREAAEGRIEMAHAFAAVGQLYASLAIDERLEEIGRQINFLTGGRS